MKIRMRFVLVLLLALGLDPRCSPMGFVFLVGDFVAGCGMFRPLVAVSGGGGHVLRWSSTEMMPMDVQRFRCDLEGSELLTLAASHVLVVFVDSCWARRRPAASCRSGGGCGAASARLGKGLEEEEFCNEVPGVLSCNFLLFPGFQGMYSLL